MQHQPDPNFQFSPFLHFSTSASYGVTRHSGYPSMHSVRSDNVGAVKLQSGAPVFFREPQITNIYPLIKRQIHKRTRSIRAANPQHPVMCVQGESKIGPERIRSGVPKFSALETPSTSNAGTKHLTSDIGFVVMRMESAPQGIDRYKNADHDNNQKRRFWGQRPRRHQDQNDGDDIDKQVK